MHGYRRARPLVTMFYVSMPSQHHGTVWGSHVSGACTLGFDAPGTTGQFRAYLQACFAPEEGSCATLALQRWLATLYSRSRLRWRKLRPLHPERLRAPPLRQGPELARGLGRALGR